MGIVCFFFLYFIVLNFWILIYINFEILNKDVNEICVLSFLFRDFFGLLRNFFRSDYVIYKDDLYDILFILWD